MSHYLNNQFQLKSYLSQAQYRISYVGETTIVKTFG